MTESGYYPEGAEFDSSAPYNQSEIPEKEFEVTISQTLSKTVTVSTNDYEPEVVEEKHNDIYEYNAITDNTDWEQAYHENDYHTPEQLIGLFKRYLEAELGGKQDIPRSPSYLKHLIKECEDWYEDDIEYIGE